MAPIPQLNLSLSTTDSKVSPFYAGEGTQISHTDTALKQHTITIYITDEESGIVRLNINKSNEKQPQSIEIPTYKMLVIDSLTSEKHTYEVTRDTMTLVEKKNTRSTFWQFLNFDFIKPQKYTYNTLTFEPLHQEIENYSLSKYRKLDHDTLNYFFKKNDNNISLFAGDYNTIDISQNLKNMFLVVDGQKGQRFIGDILYREKFLKLSPKVELQLIKRKYTPKTIEFDKKGAINKIVYL